MKGAKAWQLKALSISFMCSIICWFLYFNHNAMYCSVVRKQIAMKNCIILLLYCYIKQLQWVFGFLSVSVLSCYCQKLGYNIRRKTVWCFYLNFTNWANVIEFYFYSDMGLRELWYLNGLYLYLHFLSPAWCLCFRRWYWTRPGPSSSHWEFQQCVSFDGCWVPGYGTAPLLKPKDGSVGGEEWYGKRR